MAGVSRLADHGEITADESVALVPTRAGFRQAWTSEATGATETVRRDDFRDRLE